MRRALFQTVKVIPGGTGAAIDRTGFLSAIFSIEASAFTGSPTKAQLKVSVSDCDTSDGDFAAVTDKLISLGETLEGIEIKAGDLLNIDLDLIGCKRFIKLSPQITFTGGTNPAATVAYALALGDACQMPV